MNLSNILESDLDRIFNDLTKDERDYLSEKSILITGCAGFLGYYFMKFLDFQSKNLRIKKVIALDNFMLGKPDWINEIQKNPVFDIRQLDVIHDDIVSEIGQTHIDFVIHMASIASPTFYRKYPIATIDANLIGLNTLLRHYKNSNLDGFLFFSSSEVYGDPNPENIPTHEDYRGNVAMIGPRACYDEAKRCGETYSYLYAQEFGMKITIVRPFNNYGPGMRLSDKRVPADFAKAIVEGKNIQIFSSGNPTRTFCYVSDAITGYLKALLSKRFDYYNIGVETPEISVKQLADIYQSAGAEVYGYKGIVEFSPPPDENYLTHNPNRRCPRIDKARKKLNYHPKIEVTEGVKKFLLFLKENGDFQ